MKKNQFLKKIKIFSLLSFVIVILGSSLLFLLRSYFKKPEFTLETNVTSLSEPEENNQNIEMLSDFEQVPPWDTSPQKGFSLKRSKEYVTEGKHSLSVTFPKGGLPSINTRKLKNFWNKYEYFAFDVYNPEDETISLFVRLDDLHPRRINIPYQLQKGWNKIKIPQSRIATKIDATHVGFIVLFLKNPKKKHTLYFDNMRLERSSLLPGLESQLSTHESQVNALVDSLKEQGTPQSPVEEQKDYPQGTVPVTLAKLKQVAHNHPLISAGIPFAPGQLTSESNIVFIGTDLQEIPIAVKVLARWPKDQSIRSILVQFRTKIEKVYKPILMQWGYRRKTEDLDIVEPVWDFPEGFILMPSQWLCDSQVIGEHVPMGKGGFPGYEKRIENYFPKMLAKGWTGDLRVDGYYSTPHVFYQLYVRSGELPYFLSARKELLYYRDQQVIQEGPDKGRSTQYKNPRYIYVQALADDYLLTGDPRSLEVARSMAKYLKTHFDPSYAYFQKNETRFWTERRHAFPFLGILTYYEITGDKEYLKVADEFMKNLYKTQKEWPERGGFIHNLYSHDPEEGARQDEYGGSPFMTGLLLEAIIKYHRLTDSDIAADSIFRALDWLIAEALTEKGDSFLYTTADIYRGGKGTPDLNLLLVHAFGYGYRLSDYQRKDYFQIGVNIFQTGVQRAYLKKRKHFNQNYRSSGHFLAYIKDAPERGDLQLPQKKVTKVSRAKEAILYYENFTYSKGVFKERKSTKLTLDQSMGDHSNNALKIDRKFGKAGLAASIQLDDWNISTHSFLTFAYRIPVGMSVGVGVKTSFDDWICVAWTQEAQCNHTMAKISYPLINDGQWHKIKINVKHAVQSVLSKVERLSELQFHNSSSSNTLQAFWIDDFKISR